MPIQLRRTPNKKRKQAKPSMPLPEAIDGGSWEVKQSSQRRDVTTALRPGGGGSLSIPLGGGEVERAIRVHEQMHAAITPRDPEAWDGVDPVVLELCEDYRVHQAMAIEGFQKSLVALGELAPELAIEWDRLKLDYDAASKARDKAGRSLKRIPPRAIVGARVMAAWGTGLWPSEYNHAYRLDKEAAEFGERLAIDMSPGRINDGELRPFEQAKIAAELLCETFGTPGDPVTEQDEQEAPPQPQPLMPNPTYSSTHTTSFVQALQEVREQTRHGGNPTMSTANGTPIYIWGDIKIIEKPRPLRLNGKMIGGKKKLPDVRGRSLRQVSRLAKDGKVFRRKYPIKRRGGAVLIDCSGSMHLTPDQVQSIMIALPAAVIATYCATHGRGELWIVARDGKRAKRDDLSHPSFNQNVIDGPALEWLNQQKGPRYWVSDGLVTERAAIHTPRAVAICRVLQERGKIVRVPTVDGVLAEEGWERVS